MSNFEIEEKDGKIWIVNHTAHHIDGEPFKYEQGDEIDAEFLCKECNELFQAKIDLNEIMNLVHNVKYGKLEWSDLDDYFYKGKSMEEMLKEEW